MIEFPPLVEKPTAGRRLAEGGVIEFPPLVEVKIEELGLLPFENEARPDGRHGGGDVIYALLNEDQAYFLLTLSRFFQKSEGFRLKREPFSPPSAGFSCRISVNRCLKSELRNRRKVGQCSFLLLEILKWKRLWK